MAKNTFTNKYFVSGMVDYLKDAVIQNGFYLAQCIDYRTDPQGLTLMPSALKESGTVVTDLLKCADTVPSNLSVYAYGNTGNIYNRTSAGSWSNLRTIAESHGNGIGYFTGDDYLYYAADSKVGRYGPISGTPNFTDDFLTVVGGVPQNTNSLSLVAASSQYATAADSASLSITGDLTLEAFFKLNSIPAVGSSMCLLGKWDESGATRSYKLDLYGVSGYFGDGSDGALTISADTTEAPIDSACIGTSGTQVLTATNVSFAQGQVLLIIQMQGTNAGQWERNTIQGYTAGTITLGTPLKNTYTTGAQVRVMKQYSAITVNSGKTWTCKAWNGTVGGILANLCSGTITVTGTVNANVCGFRGGAAVSAPPNTSVTGNSGEGTGGASVSTQTSANGNASGASTTTTNSSSHGSAGTSGGGNATVGGSATVGAWSGTIGTPGYQSGSSDLTTLTLGGASGSTGIYDGYTGAAGANGGGIVFLTGTTITISGTISANGADGNASGGQGQFGGSGGGAGGSILLKAQIATLGSALIIANGGTGSIPTTGGGVGGNGSVGRVHLDYYTSYTGTSTPTLDVTQDNSLVTTNTTQARLGISNDGTNFEYLTQNLNGLTTGTWNRLSVSWVASTSMASFYLNAVALGTFKGTKTAIHDNASLLYVGGNKGVSAVGNFFDGLLDDMRILENAQTASQISVNNMIQLASNYAGLNAYYKVNADYNDATANTNTLTPHGSPTFSTDVPFPAPTTRLDIDQSYTTTGDTSAVGTTIVESAGQQVVFAPTLDPQKSIAVNINAKGTGDWTITVHDLQNNLIASKTVANASLNTGYFEFIFSTPWRIVINKTYHFHITSTVADGSTISSGHNNVSTSDFYTYYNFLVNDAQFHPIAPMLNKMVIGNERYLATWDGAFYNANFIAFPPQTHVRCFGFWREYLVIGTWRETTSGTPNIYDWPTGKLYFWDGISLTFNFWVDVPEGQVNALLGNNNILYVWAGYKGDMLAYQGGYTTLSTSAQKIKRMPLQARGDYLEIYPGAVAMWRSLVHSGVAVSSNSTSILKGVYSWGTLNRLYDESLSLDYTLSTGNTGNTVKIGLVYPIGQTLLIGWQDGSGYGCDQVTFTNPPANYGQLQTTIQDSDMVWKEKIPLILRADHLTLNSGESVDIKYKIDRSLNWTTSDTNSTSGSRNTKAEIQSGRGHEYQFAVELMTTGSTSPTLLGLSASIEGAEEEQQL